MLYLKVLWPNDGHQIVPAADVNYADGPYVTWTRPPDCGGGCGSYYRGDFLAVYVMSESGSTLDKIRGFTPDEAAEMPRAEKRPVAVDARQSAAVDPRQNAAVE